MSLKSIKFATCRRLFGVVVPIPTLPLNVAAAKLEPPVTLKAEVVAVVKVALEATKLPSNVPPLTVNPVVVALPTKSLPPNNVSETVRLVVEALVREIL